MLSPDLQPIRRGQVWRSTKHRTHVRVLSSPSWAVRTVNCTANGDIPEHRPYIKHLDVARFRERYTYVGEVHG